MYSVDNVIIHDLDSRIKVKKLFGFYFKGFDKIANCLPLGLLYAKTLGNDYDIEVAFQCGLPTRLVGYSKNDSAVHIIWMHAFDMYEDCFARADKVLCVSRENAERCKAIMGNRVNVDYCYNLVNDTRIKNLSLESVEFKSKTLPRFVSVGRHSPEKGYVRLIRILGGLRKEGYLFSLVLIGDGSEHANIARAIEEEKLNDCVELVGMQNNPHKYVAKSDVFICSSFSEGYSTACTEAVILEVPIITTRVGGAKEIIDDCCCGILCETDDDSLKNAIRTVLKNPELIIQWKKILEQTCKRFQLSYRAEKVKNLFESFEKMMTKEPGKND